MNFKNIFILPNVIGDRSRKRFGGIFIKIPKVTTPRSSLLGRLVSCVDSRVKDLGEIPDRSFWNIVNLLRLPLSSILALNSPPSPI